MNRKIYLSPFLCPFLTFLRAMYWLSMLLLFQAACAERRDCPDSTQNSFECAQYLERAVKKSADLKFTRKNGALTIPLKNGSKIYRNSGEGVSTEKYSVVQYLKDSGYVVIHVQYWENESYLLLNIHSGVELKLEGNPVPSPDEKRFVAARMDIDVGRNPNSITVYRFRDGKLVKEYMLTPDWGPSNIEWLSNTKISLKKNVVDTSAGAYKVRTQKAHLVLSGGVWYLVADQNP